MTIDEALQYAKTRLSDVRVAEILLGFILEKSRTFLYTWPQQNLTSAQQMQFMALLDRAAKGEPVAYLIGQKEFWSLPLTVNQHVLIPRADTEILVETVLAQLAVTAQHILELGTGSGAIALALAVERPQWHITAVDISPLALLVARDNVMRLGVNNITFIQSDWFTALEGLQFDAIISNPPYIAANDAVLDSTLRYEPRLALEAGPQGLDSLYHIIDNACQYLVPSGYLFLEHGATQDSDVAQYMYNKGWVEIKQCEDLSGLPRVTWGRHS